MSWIRSLLAAGKKPVLEIIDEVPKAEWPQLEVAYIQFFREEGFDLVNGSLGGEGNNGYIRSEEWSVKMRVSLLGNTNGLGSKRPPEFCAKIRARMLGKKYHLGMKHSEETRAKISALQKGKKRGPYKKKT